jgi:WD40 repeat protein
MNLVTTLSGHCEAVSSLALSSDSKLLASGSEDQTIKLWGWQKR